MTPAVLVPELTLLGARAAARAAMGRHATAPSSRGTVAVAAPSLVGWSQLSPRIALSRGIREGALLPGSAQDSGREVLRVPWATTGPLEFEQAMSADPVNAAKPADLGWLKDATITPFEVPEVRVALRLDEPPPRTLYHYTSMAALHGIVTSGTIHACHFLTMNDFTEGQIAVMHLVRLFNSVTHDSPLPQNQARGFRRWLSLQVQASMESDTFVASFTPSPDDLSQWVHYGDSSRGVAIGVDAESFGIGSPPPQTEVDANDWRPLLAPVTYAPSVQLQAVSAWLRAMEGALAARKDHPWAANPTAMPRLMFSDNVYGFAALSALLKHPTFFAEQEWRYMVSMPRMAAKEVSAIQFKTGRKGVVPYLAVGNKDPSKPFPLRAFVTGPAASPGAHETLSLLLNRLGWHLQGMQHMMKTFGPDHAPCGSDGRFVIYPGSSSAPYQP